MCQENGIGLHANSVLLLKVKIESEHRSTTKYSLVKIIKQLDDINDSRTANGSCITINTLTNS